MFNFIMKNIFMLLMLIFSTIGTKAQLLWKISGNDLASPSYVFGSHHLSPLSILDSISGFKQSMNNVEQVYGELVMDVLKDSINIQKLQQASLLSGDTTIRSLTTKAQYDSMNVKIKQLMGVDLKVMEKLKPAALIMQISIILDMKSIKSFNPQQQIDGWIQTKARVLGKKVGGLENVDYQINVVFNSQSLQRQTEQLFCKLMHLDFLAQQAQRIITAYINQDLGLVVEIMKEKTGTACDALPEEEESLIYERNAKWVKSMYSIMKEKSTLFVVGCGHLPGKKGILNLLKKEGYMIKPIK